MACMLVFRVPSLGPSHPLEPAEPCFGRPIPSRVHVPSYHMHSSSSIRTQHTRRLLYSKSNIDASNHRTDNIILSELTVAGVPDGLVGGPRAYRDQFRGFMSHRVHAHRVFFLHKKNDQRKAGERESATFDENRRAQWE